MQRIVLTGFMGSGKTTVGRLLAERLGWEFQDLDREVERHASKSVPAIFAEHGEARFRELEAEVLAPLLDREKLVLALGGGALEYAPTANLLSSVPETQVVYLAAPFATLAERCRAESLEPGAVSRPLFQDRAAAELRLARREPLYRSLAHTKLVTEGISAEEAAHRLLTEIFPD